MFIIVPDGIGHGRTSKPSDGLRARFPRYGFSLTPLGEALKSDAPGFARSTILTMAGRWSWQAWEEFQYSVETGRSAIEKVFGKSHFDLLRARSLTYPRPRLTRQLSRVHTAWTVG